ncbi:MAG: D-serine ammonia-lyase [Clostridiaceae bacterium]|nr:D-serine ammonia-lyase [Clostridiaceae bacterium]
MCDLSMAALLKKDPVLPRVAAAEEVLWLNPGLQSAETALPRMELGMADILDAEARLQRFAPFIRVRFPETAPRGGLIESPLTPIPRMQRLLEERFGAVIPGRLLLKQDSHLAIAGSVKARGGIYEVLKHTEELAMENGLLSETDDYAKLASPEMREFFSRYTVQVGSTGNLGLSIGIASAAVGYKVIVHMSVDAKQWKKDLLRAHGVQVIEYEADYGEAVKQGRARSDADPMSYFVDDENSRNLFLGYAVAALRLRQQLAEQNVAVDREHPLLVTIPCGVGGAPGGVAFGLKHVFGDSVHCFFAEPTQAPCMLAGMATGLHSKVSVQDLGLTGLTEADGLAVGRPSGFVGGVMEPLLSGEVTIADPKLYTFMRALLESENIFLEPSACAAFQGPAELLRQPEGRDYAARQGLTAERLANSTHIAWATGGALVPEDIRKAYQTMYL